MFEACRLAGVPRIIYASTVVTSWGHLLDEPYNPLIPQERLAIEKPFEELLAPGSFYIHALTVYRPFARRGIASEFIRFANRLASDRGFAELSLYCFEGNRPAVRLYEKHGFEAIDRRPMVAHPRIEETGDILLMTCPVHQQRN